MHFVAESHVGRSINGPVVGTFALLQGALVYWRGLSSNLKQGGVLPNSPYFDRPNILLAGQDRFFARRKFSLLDLNPLWT